MDYPLIQNFLHSPAAHDSACHFAEEKQVVPPEADRDDAS
jgi:oligopeptide transport system ATP-binding protein